MERNQEIVLFSFMEIFFDKLSVIEFCMEDNFFNLYIQILEFMCEFKYEINVVKLILNELEKFVNFVWVSIEDLQ